MAQSLLLLESDCLYIGSGQVNDLLGGIRRSNLHESPTSMGQLGVALTQHHWGEIYLEEINGQGGRTL